MEIRNVRYFLHSQPLALYQGTTSRASLDYVLSYFQADLSKLGFKQERNELGLFLTHTHEALLTAGPSAPLRSGRDDNISWARASLAKI
jgi:hypothetical protein